MEKWTNIEEKILFLERHIEQLDEALRAMDARLDGIKRDVDRIGDDVDAIVKGRLIDESDGGLDDGLVPPPHAAG